jgi:hypothetical protein
MEPSDVITKLRGDAAAQVSSYGFKHSSTRSYGKLVFAGYEGGAGFKAKKAYSRGHEKRAGASIPRPFSRPVAPRVSEKTYAGSPGSEKVCTSEAQLPINLPKSNYPAHPLFDLLLWRV